MALLASTAIGQGTLGAPAAVSLSDTISGNLASAGAILEVKNGSGSSINVTFTDPGRTAYGSTAASGLATPVAVANAATKRWKLHAGLVDPATNLITVAFSAITSVTYELYF